MNRENLKRMADYIRTVPQENFTISYYRSGSERYHKCDSVGCVIGHCTVLDDIDNIPTFQGGDIRFDEWSKIFTELVPYSGKWKWCFSTYWKQIDNTPTGAAERIEWLLNHGLPEDWYEQMTGETPLIYKQP